MIEKTINSLISKGLFTGSTNTITDSLRYNYAKEYAKLSGGDFDKLSSSNKKYALKLAGLNLSKLCSSTSSGFVYCISNPSFAGFVKVGITKDVVIRLRGYQTYDPHRAYRLECYRFVEDKRRIEKELLRKFKVIGDKGEWVSDLSIINFIKTFK